MILRKYCILFLLLLFCVPVSFAQQNSDEQPAKPTKTRILFILDCSSSMWEKWQSDSKIKITQTVLSRFLDSADNDANVEVALRVFGHLNKNAYGTRLEVPFEKNNTLKIRNKIKTLVPKGNCTVASALSSSLNDFPACDECRNLVVIVTDGVDDCEGDICAVAANIQQSGAIVKTFVIGIGNKDNIEDNYNCAGPFFAVKNEEAFTSTLYNLENLSTGLAKVRVNLLDSYGNPSESNVPLTFYDKNNGLVKYNLIHTLTSNSLPDTFLIDPLLSYDLVVNTFPPVTIKNLTFEAYKNNLVTAKIPQGSLIVKSVGKSNLPEMNAIALVRETGKTDIITWQNFNDKREYIVGKYDLEIMTLPRTILKNVEIFQSSVTKIEIPTQGLANINKGKDITIGVLFVQRDNDKLEWVCQLDESKATESVLLLPGKYIVLVRNKNKSKTSETITKEFRIESGQTTNVFLNK